MAKLSWWQQTGPRRADRARSATIAAPRRFSPRSNEQCPRCTNLNRSLAGRLSCHSGIDRCAGLRLVGTATRQHEKDIDHTRGIIAAETDPPVAYSQPPFPRPALEPLGVAHGQAGDGVEDSLAVGAREPAQRLERGRAELHPPRLLAQSKRSSRARSMGIPGSSIAAAAAASSPGVAVSSSQGAASRMAIIGSRARSK